MITPPLFLDIDKVMRMHLSLIERYGGEAGLRDAGLLHSAIAMPQASFGGEFLHTDIFEMAAAYLFHLVQNHPFVDGNKRAGLVAALAFPDLNDIEVITSQEAMYDLTIAVAAGQAGKGNIAAFFRSAVSSQP
jgi:death-on-curing protein